MSSVRFNWEVARGWFFRNFFRLLVIASSFAMWAVPAWILGAVWGLHLAWPVHLAGAFLTYMLNRLVIRGSRSRPSAWRRRYSAVALVLLLCAGFLAASSALFGVAGVVASFANPEAGRVAASALRYWGLSGMAVVAGALTFGYTGGQRQLRVNHLEIPLPGWGRRLRVLQLSDIHIGQNLNVDQLEEFVARANAESPDLVCLTGDIVDGPQADMERFFPILARLKGPLGLFAILGNHDHYAGAEKVEEALTRHGICVLRDSSVTLESDGAKLHLMGLDDRGIDWARGVHGHEVLTGLLDEAPSGVARLLLVHRPDIFRQAAAAGVELTLSGHTHGGQLAVPWFGARRRNLAELMTRFDRGVFRRGDSILYVNCGLGVTGQRIRLFTPREISIFDLCAPAGNGLRREVAVADLPEIVQPVTAAV